MTANLQEKQLPMARDRNVGTERSEGLIGSGVVLSTATQFFRRGRALEVDEVAPIGATSS